MEKELIRITKEFGHDNIPIAFIAKPGPGVISGYIYYYKDNEIKESIVTDLNIIKKTHVSNSIKPYMTTLINDYEQIKFKAIVYAQDDIKVLYRVLLTGNSEFEQFFLESGIRLDYTDNNFDLIDKI